MSVNDSAAAAETFSNEVYAPKVGKLAEALAKAQGEVKNPSKGGVNPHFNSKFATLSEGIDAIRSAFSKHGVAYVQMTEVRGDVLFLITQLIHGSGETLRGEWPVGSFGKLTPQQIGSALTYARRYSLFSIAGIAGAEDDDDGETAMVRGNDRLPPPPPKTTIESGLKKAPDWRELRLRLSAAGSLEEVTRLDAAFKRAYPNMSKDDLEELKRLIAEAVKPFFEKSEMSK